MASGPVRSDQTEPLLAEVMPGPARSAQNATVPPALRRGSEKKSKVTPAGRPGAGAPESTTVRNVGPAWAANPAAKVRANANPDGLVVMAGLRAPGSATGWSRTWLQIR